MKKILFGLMGLLFSISANAACNLFNGYNSAAVTLDETNNVLSNKLIDTKTSFQLQVQMQKTDNSYLLPINQVGIATGKQTFTFNVPEDIKYFAIKHNGSARDIIITSDNLLPSAGTYTLSMDVLSNDPSTVGGLRIKDIMLEQGSTATAYTPYYAECIERCKNLFDGQIEQGGIQFADGRTTSQSIYLYSVNPIPVTPNTSYVLSADTNIIKKGEIYFYKNNGEYIGHINTLQTLPRTFTTPENAYQVKFILTGSGEDLQPSDATNVQLEQGSTATAYVPYVAACHKIQVATTKYVETQFSDLGTRLAAAVNTVNTVVTNTITQAASIATLQSGKQTRPDETCPAGKKCLLVEGTDGQPHWYEIVTSRLPDGYTELEYIESTGTQWIDTNVPVTDDISWEGRLLSKNDTDKATSIFGYRWTETPTATGNMRFVFLYPNGAFAVRFGVNASQSNLVMSGSEVITLKYENDKFYANGNLFFTETDKNHDGEAQSGYLFNANALYNVDIIPSKMKLYYFKMWDNGTLVRDFVPAKNSSGIIGMYDLVSGEFFTNQGTGTFIGGQPVFN